MNDGKINKLSGNSILETEMIETRQEPEIIFSSISDWMSKRKMINRKNTNRIADRNLALNGT